MAKRTSIPRLAKLYNVVERLRSLELGIAVSALDDVTVARQHEIALGRNEGTKGQASLGSGDAEGWRIALLASACSEVRSERLASLCLGRKADLEEAAVLHRASREQAEQMEQMQRKEHDQQKSESSRRSQAESDDRFSARAAWRNQRTSRKTA
jgi:hypothetical protein